MSVTLPFSYHFYLDPDDASGDKAVLELEDPEMPADPALAAATRCMHDAVAPIASQVGAGLHEDTRWKAKVQIQIGE
jgi:hypothetical protein